MPFGAFTTYTLDDDEMNIYIPLASDAVLLIKPFFDLYYTSDDDGEHTYAFYIRYHHINKTLL